MVHSFSSDYKNGNITITFTDGDEVKTIFFVNSTVAYDIAYNTLQWRYDMSGYTEYQGDSGYLKAITHMRKCGLSFMKHPQDCDMFIPHYKA